MERLLDIAIVGYGTAGQAVARFLRRQGHRLDIFERAPQPGPVGAGLLLQPTGLGVLGELGLADAAVACGEPIARLFGVTPSGRRVIDMHYAGLDPAWFGLGIQRGALFEILRDAELAPNLHCGATIVAIDHAARELRDERGARHGPYDLVLVAGGAASTLRPPELVRRDRPYPWGALWCLCADPERQWRGELLQRYAKASRMAGILPVGRLPGQGDTERRVSLFWSLPSNRLAPTLERGLDALSDEIGGYWPQIRPLLDTLVDVREFAPAHYRDAVLRRFAQGRVAWLGDAAHAMSPQLGQGANMALCDAYGLAQALERERDVDAALGRYDRERRSHVGIYQFLSRWMTPLFQSDLDWAAALRDTLFGPLGRAPLMRGEMLKVLAGVKAGLFRRVPVSSTACVAGAAQSPLDSGAT
ncbi:FAD-dependent oxidoreductase [Tahibacter soli]|uniref:NAD(P)/FAD-dependent oxidoreductase n=1 Tax=Tahibacter soli TaxID=2983605 RepID=A0A9X3YP79_9GAMM|nr:NAD(P)/FAD-dependent oxidoreductase [Tahibacter soli]MDC8014920.1 NAD(P)/FAD-dependent oxidoreductase [Tahibacter soli]